MSNFKFSDLKITYYKGTTKLSSAPIMKWSEENKGQYYVAYQLKSGNYISNVKWEEFKIEKSFFSTLPTDVDRDYTGSAHTLVRNYSDGVEYAGGTEWATNAGTYQTLVKPKSKYVWENGTNIAKSVTWRINKIAGEIIIYSSTNLICGETTDIMYSCKGDGTLTVSSGNSAVATASINTNEQKIKIKGIASGTTTITVKLSAGNNYTAAEKTIAVTVGKKSATLSVGSNQSLIVGNSANKTYTYDGDGTVSVTSSNSGIATATVNTSNKTITINGVAVGTATITLKASEGATYNVASNKTISVTVTKKAPTLTIDQTAKTLYVDDNEIRTYTYVGDGVVSVTSSNPGVATATLNASDKTIAIKGVAKGISTITLKASEGSTYNAASDKTISITVIKKTATMTATASAQKILAETSATITYTYDGDGAITATNSNLESASITTNTETKTITVNGLSAGYVTITINAAEGAHYDATQKKVELIIYEIISSEHITLASTTETYTGKTIKPAVTVKINDKTLKENTDYTVKYLDNVDTGTAKVEIEGIGTYEGKEEKTFTIEPAVPTLAFDKEYVPIIREKTEEVGYEYNGDGETSMKVANSSVADVSLDLENKKITINALKVGKTKVTISATAGRNYKAISKTIDIAVGEYILGNNDVTLDDEAMTYTGKPIAKNVTVTVKDKTLRKGKDYTVSYTDNTNIGTATLTVTGVGEYIGQVSKTFAIVKATPKITISNLSQKLKNLQPVSYKVNPAITDGVVKIEYEVSGDYREELPTELGKYNDRVTLSNDSNLEDAVQVAELDVNDKAFGGSGSSGSGSTVGSSAGTTTKYTIEVIKADNGKIRPSTTSVEEGENITFEIKPNEGYVISSVLVDDEDVGTDAQYTFRNVHTNHTITAEFIKEDDSTTDEETKPVDGNDSGTIFDDVNTTDWYYEPVEYVAENKLFNGVSEKSFAPNNNMTRGMLVTVLYRLNGATEKDKAEFSDVEEKMYYSEAIAWAAKNGIVNGIGDGKFAPDKDISREDLATIIARYINKEGLKIASENEGTDSYADESTIAEYALESVKLLREKGLMTGKTANTFDPKGLTTRAEVATLLMRLAKKIK